MKRILVYLGMAVLLFQASCEMGSDDDDNDDDAVVNEAESKVQFLVTSPLKVDTSVIKEYVCQVHSIRHIELRAQERGYLQEIYVDEGQFVKKGRLLFRIMPRLYEAELEKAKAEAKVAEIEYKNTNQLAEANIVAPNELAMAKARMERARAELALAQTHLDFTSIRAPFDGIIDRFHVRLGSLVEEGDLLTTLSDNSKMWVYFNVPEAEYLEFISNNKNARPTVSLVMANNEIFPYKGVVETIEADFNNETGNIAFRATFPNPDGLLRHGETGNIRMTEPMHDALLIPQKATFEVLDKKYVYVVDKDNTIRSRQIDVVGGLEDLFAVSSGLAQNEKILLEGIRKVNNNDKITYTYREPRTVLQSLKLHAE